jgi:hypothetical protein
MPMRRTIGISRLLSSSVDVIAQTLERSTFRHPIQPYSIRLGKTETRIGKTRSGSAVCGVQ